MATDIRAGGAWFGLSVRGAQFQRGMAQAQGSVFSLSRAFERFRASMVASAVATAAYAAGIGAIYAAFRGADAVVNFENRIREATSVLQGHTLSAEGVTEVYDKLFGIARRSRTSLDGVVTIFTRVAQAGEGLSFGLNSLLTFTEALQKTVALSGATASEAEGALIQLSQGIGSGVLRGQELTSVLEQLGPVADIIAKRLGVFRGSLRELGEQGLISANDVVRAFIEAESEINRRFAELKLTLGSAFQVLRDSITNIFGRFADSSGFVQALARSILSLADNIELLARAVAGAVTAFVALTSLKLIVGIASLAATLPVLFVTHPILAFGRAVALLPKILAATIGAFIAFGDRIQVFSEGVGTVNDLIAFSAQLFKEWAGIGQETGDEIKTLQDVFYDFADAASGVVGDVILAGFKMVAAWRAIALTFEDLFSDRIIRNLKFLAGASGILIDALIKQFGGILDIIGGSDIADSFYERLHEQFDLLLPTFDEFRGKFLGFAAERNKANEEAQETLKTNDKLIFQFKELAQLATGGIDLNLVSLGNIDQLTKIAQKLDEIAAGALKRFETALVDVFRTGRLEAGDFLDALTSDVLTALIRNQITGPLAEGLQDLFSSCLLYTSPSPRDS